MAPPLPRIVARRDFLRAAASGRKVARPGLVLQALAVPGQPMRVGFTVSRKVGNAVLRNRARRRLRAAVEQVLRNGLPEGRPEGWDVVLIGRAGTLDRPFDALCTDLQDALLRTGVRG